MPVARRTKAKKRRKTKWHLPVLVEQDKDGTFIVSVPSLTGCRSYGYTLNEAMQNIAEAAELCLEDEAPFSHGTFVGVRDLEIVR